MRVRVRVRVRVSSVSNAALKPPRRQRRRHPVPLRVRG